MPPKLDVNDFGFLLAPDRNGKYVYNGVRGNVMRRPKKELEMAISMLPETERVKVIRLWGISSITEFGTGRAILVAEVFSDFQGF